MRSKFKYEIDKDDDNKTISRNVSIIIKAKNKKIEEELFNNLQEYITKNTNYNFMYAWEDEEGITGFAKVDNKEEMEEIKYYYKEWKKCLTRGD